MSENEIKPVDGAIPARKFDGQLWIPADVAIELRSKDRAAIDRLTAERDQLKLILDLVHGEGIREKFAALTAERDAAVADAERRLQLIRDTLANTEWRHGAHNIHRELKAEVRSADAARSLDDSPMARMASALREKAAVERSQYDKRVQSGEWGPMPELGAEAVFCVACDGAGWDGDSRERTCQSCAGSGLAARSEGGV